MKSCWFSMDIARTELYKENSSPIIYAFQHFRPRSLLPKSHGDAAPRFLLTVSNCVLLLAQVPWKRKNHVSLLFSRRYIVLMKEAPSAYAVQLVAMFMFLPNALSTVNLIFLKNIDKASKVIFFFAKNDPGLSYSILHSIYPTMNVNSTCHSKHYNFVLLKKGSFFRKL